MRRTNHTTFDLNSSQLTNNTIFWHPINANRTILSLVTSYRKNLSPGELSPGELKVDGLLLSLIIAAVKVIPGLSTSRNKTVARPHDNTQFRSQPKSHWKNASRARRGDVDLLWTTVKRKQKLTFQKRRNAKETWHSDLHHHVTINSNLTQTSIAINFKKGRLGKLTLSWSHTICENLHERLT